MAAYSDPGFRRNSVDNEPISRPRFEVWTCEISHNECWIYRTFCQSPEGFVCVVHCILHDGNHRDVKIVGRMRFWDFCSERFSNQIGWNFTFKTMVKDHLWRRKIASPQNLTSRTMTSQDSAILWWDVVWNATVRAHRGLEFRTHLLDSRLFWQIAPSEWRRKVMVW